MDLEYAQSHLNSLSDTAQFFNFNIGRGDIEATRCFKTGLYSLIDRLIQRNSIFLPQTEAKIEKISKLANQYNESEFARRKQNSVGSLVDDERVPGLTTNITINNSVRKKQ